jgi:hypothetical protein
MNYLRKFENFRTPYIDRRALETRIKPIGDIKKDVEIRIDVEAVGHAIQRQFRHGVKDDGRGRLVSDITEDEILDNIEMAIEPLTIALMQDEFNINQDIDNYPTRGVKAGEPNRFLIRNKDTYLNIVCELKSGKNEFTLLVITVMRKEEFKEYKGQFVIEI